MFINIIGIFGGLVIFLYGLQKTNLNLRQAFGNKLQAWINKITIYHSLSLFFGIFLTFTMQSSTAATSLLVGLINTGLMTLSQGLQILIGTSIGTTIATQIITFNIAQYAFVLILFGYGLNILSKKRRYQFLGAVLLGIGFIFLGMKLISDFAEPLKNNHSLLTLISHLQGIPVATFLLSILITSILQSSTAMMGLTISLSSQGIIPFELAIPIILGSHLGSCTTVLFVGVGKTSQAKTLTFGNLFYKILGVTIFFFLMKPLSSVATFFTPHLPRQIAIAHTIIIVGNALLVYPFLSLFTSFLQKLFPQAKQEESMYHPKFLDDNVLETPDLALYLARKELVRMANTVDEMFVGIMKVFFNQDENLLYKLCKMDRIVDNLSNAIIRYLTEMKFEDLTPEQSSETYGLLNIVNDFEHIGDLIDKDIVPIIEKQIDNELKLSEAGILEIKKLYKMVYQNFYQSLGAFALGDKRLAQKALQQKDMVVECEAKMRRSHIDRLHQGVELSRQTSSIHFDLINILKQISEHASLISEIVLNNR
jgi:phosphate:Na+ symporter